MRQYTRKEIITVINEKINRKEPIIVCGAGAGIIAKAAQKAGADLILADYAAIMRADGCPSRIAALPYADANGGMIQMAERLLPIMDSTPVIVGIGAANPYRDLDNTIEEMMTLGFSGICNMPTVGMYGAAFRQELETDDYGYSKEVDMIARCRKLGIFSVANVYSQKDAEEMADAGADMVIANYHYSDGDSAEKAFEELKRMTDAALSRKSDILVTLQCCPFSSPEEIRQAFAVTAAHGIMGASAIEKAPAVSALKSAFDEILSLRI